MPSIARTSGVALLQLRSASDELSASVAPLVVDSLSD